MKIIQSLPGIGPERAQQLLEKFGTVEKVMMASSDDLQTLEGIGPKTASGIRDVLQEEEVMVLRHE